MAGYEAVRTALRSRSKGSRLLFGEFEPRKTSPLPCKQERAASPLAIIAVPGCTALSLYHNITVVQISSGVWGQTAPIENSL
jgi:hypothetical protein